MGGGGAAGGGGPPTARQAYTGFIRALPELRQALGEGASVADGRDLWLADRGATGLDARLEQFAIDQWLVEVEYAGPVDEMSLLWTREEEGTSGGDHVLDDGYAGIVERLAEALDIRLESPVTEIVVGPDGVLVTTGGTQCPGSHVVVTVPLGVLKAGTITFSPPLPARKQAAIDALQMGNLEKVVLTWEERWWHPGGGWFVDATASGRFPMVVDATDWAGAPTLVLLYGGRYARAIQSERSDAAIVEAALDVVSSLYAEVPPPPAASRVTHWTTDPWALGSYSFLPVGSSRTDIEALAEPVGGRLLFAGEATYWQYYETAHGAMLSGLREAERLGVTPGSVPGLEAW